VGADLRGECGALRVAGDELDVLDAATLQEVSGRSYNVSVCVTHVGNGDGREDGSRRQVPQTKGVCLLNA
jgi:hypothetical protein